MVQPLSEKFAMPYSSWATINRVLMAYNAAFEQEKPTVQDIATLAGIQRPVVSANNNFLRELGILHVEQNKLTGLGRKLANGIEMGNASMVTEALQDSISNSPGLTQLLNTLRARGTMSVESFKGQIITMAHLSKNSLALNYLKTIIDYLEAAGMVEVDEDGLNYVGHTLGVKNGDRRNGDMPPSEPTPAPAPAPAPAPPSIQEDMGIPLFLGVGRLAYLKLPDQWEKKDLTKLVKMIQLALGDDDSE